MSAHYAVEAAPQSQFQFETTPRAEKPAKTAARVYAVEVFAAAACDTLMRVLNPLQKLDVTPLSVRAGSAFDAVGDAWMKIEIQFEGTDVVAEQLRRQVSTCIHVERVDLMQCAR